jgi:mycothiol system anti-sigma-R factor
MSSGNPEPAENRPAACRCDHEAERGRPAPGGGHDCEEAIATLYTFLDGELTTHRRQQIQQHLDACSPCLEAFDFEAELKIVISKRCRDEVPEELRQKVAQALSEASVVDPGPGPRADPGPAAEGGRRADLGGSPVPDA